MRKFTPTENFYWIIHDNFGGPCVSLLPFDLTSHPLAPNTSVLFVLPLSILPSSSPPAINVIPPTLSASCNFCSLFPWRTELLTRVAALGVHLLLHPQNQLQLLCPNQISVNTYFLATGTLSQIKNLRRKACYLNSRLEATTTRTRSADPISKAKQSQPKGCFLLCMIHMELQGKKASL